MEVPEPMRKPMCKELRESVVAFSVAPANRVGVHQLYKHFHSFSRSTRAKEMQEAEMQDVKSISSEDTWANSSRMMLSAVVFHLRIVYLSPSRIPL